MSSSRIVYGVHPVEELLRRRPKQVSTLFLVGRHKPLRELAERHGVAVSGVDEAALDALCEGGNHQGVAATVGEYRYLDLETLLDRLPEAPLLIVADSLMDPQNLGSIIRSALVLGAAGLVLPKDRSVRITSAVVRVSAGASEHLPCAQVTNLARTLERLKERGFWVAGAVERGGLHPAESDLTGATALVVGNEHKGIRPLVLERCDVRLTIPSGSAIASLNVAAATAALLYEAARQRRG